jgi:hypothetical protein
MMDAINNFEVLMLLEGKGMEVVWWEKDGLRFVAGEFDSQDEFNPN